MICNQYIMIMIRDSAGLGFDWSKLVLAGTGSLNWLKPVKTGQICTKLISYLQVGKYKSNSS